MLLAAVYNGPFHGIVEASTLPLLLSHIHTLAAAPYPSN